MASKAFEEENWDLDWEGHLERAKELLEVKPKAGDFYDSELTRVALAGRHNAIALGLLATEGGAIVADLANASRLLDISGSNNRSDKVSGEEGPTHDR